MLRLIFDTAALRFQTGSQRQVGIAARIRWTASDGFHGLPRTLAKCGFQAEMVRKLEPFNIPSEYPGELDLRTMHQRNELRDSRRLA